MSFTPETKETYSSHIPALRTLLVMDWDYLSPARCLELRGGNRGVILKSMLIDELRKRRFTYKGQEYPLSTNAIDQVVRELESPGLNEGLLTANERIYTQLRLGVTVTEFIDGKKHSPTIPIIDWNNIDNNSFQVTEELEVLSEQGTHTRRPDVVCYINGLPLVIIEAKRPDSGNPNKSMVAEGISQQIRNQKTDEIPYLFAYSQLLLSVSNTEGRYGTTKTPAKFWAGWHEEEFVEAHFVAVKNTQLSSEAKDALFADKPKQVRDYFESLWSGKVLPTD